MCRNTSKYPLLHARVALLLFLAAALRPVEGLAFVEKHRAAFLGPYLAMERADSGEASRSVPTIVDTPSKPFWGEKELLGPHSWWPQQQPTTASSLSPNRAASSDRVSAFEAREDQSEWLPTLKAVSPPVSGLGAWNKRELLGSSLWRDEKQPVDALLHRSTCATELGRESDLTDTCPREMKGFLSSCKY
jgi:hypothetical protein